MWHAAQLLVLKQVEKLPSRQQAQVRGIVTSAVHSVEQSFPTLKGSDKKLQALRIIQRMVDQRNLSASPDEIGVLLEEAVFLMNGGKVDGVEPGQTPLGFTK